MPRSKPFKTLSAGFLATVLLLGSPGIAASLPSTATLQEWIGEMKTSPKGPFIRIRWFCKDGTVMPPKAYACKDHGGGIQHGEWNERTKEMRAGGYEIGNVLAALDAKPFVGSNPNEKLLKQILLERFLIGWDNGWIFRGARTYRGALQSMLSSRECVKYPQRPEFLGVTASAVESPGGPAIGGKRREVI